MGQREADTPSLAEKELRERTVRRLEESIALLQQTALDVLQSKRPKGKLVLEVFYDHGHLYEPSQLLIKGAVGT